MAAGPAWADAGRVEFAGSLFKESPAKLSFGERHGCRHVHPSKLAYAHIRTLVRHVRPSVDKTRVQHWATCLETWAKAHRAHWLARAYWHWRHEYGQLWVIRRNGLDGGILARLDVLGGCETRGIPFPQNYSYAGHHDGRYQYLASTWNRAQGYYQAVTGKPVVGWTGAAYAASPAHQDVVTAFFFPAHAGEWACSA